MRSVHGVIARGAVAGIFAAAAFALWFLAIDLIRAEAFHTPLFLAQAFMGRRLEAPGGLLVIGYTIVHFSIFALIGIAIAWALERTGTQAHLLLGTIVGFLLFDIVFYASVIIAGTNIVNELGWPEVLLANVLAGLVLISYLHFTSELAEQNLRDVLRRHQIIREGLISGLIGAGSVALWFFIFDVFQDRPFFTPAALGSALFLGARGADQVEVTGAIVIGYTILHLTAFLFVGIIAAALLRAAERHPPVLLGIVLLFVTFEVFFFGLIVIVASWLLDALAEWTILVANLVAAVGMGIYLVHRHPTLRHEFNRPLEDEDRVEDPRY